MSRLLRVRPLWAFVAYLVADTICVGLGMGVPIFCILLGFPVGWYIARRASAEGAHLKIVLRTSFLHAVLCSLITFAMMAVLWGRTIPMLFDPGADLASFGIPMILYEARASFIGWQVLMILISPALQLLAAVFGAYVALLAQAGESA